MNREEFVIDLMNKGFSKSVILFSEFIDMPIKLTNKQSISIYSDDEFSFAHTTDENLYVLSTRIIGDYAGVNYLIFADEERKALLNSLVKWDIKNSSEQFKDSLLCELANIICASTIAELSNTLQIEIYADVPEIHKLKGYGLLKFTTQNLSDTQVSIAGKTDRVITLSNRYTVCSDTDINVRFLWKLDARILERVPISGIVDPYDITET